MAEVFIWGEGLVRFWTGGGTPQSGLIMWGQNINAFGLYGYEDHQTVTGRYDQHNTGRVMTVAVAALYGMDQTFAKMAKSATSMHMKIDHSGFEGSAGLMVWSAVIESYQYNGSDGNPYGWAANLRSHDWDHYP